MPFPPRFRVALSGVLVLAAMWIGLTIVRRTSAASGFLVLSYPNVAVTAGGSMSISPSAAPSGLTSASAVAAGFNGVLMVNPVTGVISVANAQPAGTFAVKVKTVSSGGVTAIQGFTLTVGSPKSCSNTTFVNAADVSVDALPASIATGDFNGDGKLDLITANTASNNVNLRMGNGAGGFTGTTALETGAGPTAVATGDFNGDGKLDFVAAATGADVIDTQFGNGAGGIIDRLFEFVRGNPSAVTTGDINGDGELDFVFTRSASTRNNFAGRLSDYSVTPDIPVGLNPQAIAGGDFNRDGKLDFATANIGDGTVSIRRGDGTGNFTGTREVSVGNSPISVTTGDFNRDGKLDLAVANKSSDTISIRLGDGVGDFSGETEVGVDNTPLSVITGDFNGDGKLDLAVANKFSNTVSIRLGDGAGGFSGTTNVSVGSQPNSVVAGDFNGDGKLDFAANNGNSNSVSIRLNSCTVNPPPTIAAGSALTRTKGVAAATATIATVSDSVATAGSLTVAATSMSMGLSVSNIVNTNGTITADVAAACNAALGTNVIGLTVTNNNNGATASANLAVNVLAASPQPATLGTYANASVIAGGSVMVTPSVAPTNAVYAMAAAPGFTGVLTVNPITGVVSVTNAPAAGTYVVTVRAASSNCNNPVAQSFTLTVRNPIACADTAFTGTNEIAVGIGPSAITLGDFNSDGKLDFAATNRGSNTVSIKLGDGAGNFSGTTQVAVGPYPTSVVAGDFNRDGKLDLAAANYEGTTVSIRLGNGAGGFSGTTEVSVNPYPASLALGDFNGDGCLDFAAANGGFSAQVSIRLGDGTGNFSTALPDLIEVGIGSDAESVVTSDFNGDGKLDLAAAHNSGAVSIRLGDGTGHFSGTTEVAVGHQPSSVSTGDFNGDGKLDLVVANAVSSNVSIRLGDGAGNFSGTTNVAVGTVPLSVATSDFNGDGKLDFAAANAGSNNISIRLGDGAGGFSSATNIAAANGPFSMATGDFNGDGKLDFAAANNSSNTVSIRLNSCTVNTPPTIAAGSLTRTQGATGSSTIATVSDGQTPASSLTVTTTNTPSGITVTNIVNTNGAITADVVASCGTAVGAYAIGLTVTDSNGATATANLIVNVTANVAPRLSYNSYAVPPGNAATILPVVGPTDDGPLASIILQSVAPVPTAGTITVNAQGRISTTNNIPVGAYVVTVRATDTCGAVKDASFSFTVCATPSITTQPIARSVTAGANVSFTIAANGPGLFYQWRKGGVALSNSATVSGAQSATLALNGVTATSAGSYDVIVASICGSAVSSTAALTVTTNAAPLLVNELRFSGPNGAEDWYVELYNNSNQAISTTGLKLNWVNAAGTQNGSINFTPDLTIKARGYYLIAGSSYSLVDVWPDEPTELLSSVGVLGGVQLCNAAGTVLDAAGTTALQASGRLQYSEGTLITALGLVTAEHAWVRKFSSVGLPIDTNNNFADFMLLATTTTPLNGVMPQPGAPGPQNSESPTVVTSTVPVAMLNPAVNATNGPNAVVENVPVTVGSATYPRSLYLRRTLTNSTGVPLNRLRFRIVVLSNGGVNTAILRALDSSDITLTINGQPVAVKGLTLEAPTQPTGGGLNSTLCAGSISFDEPLASGAKVNVQFRLGIAQGGSYRFYANVEAAN